MKQIAIAAILGLAATTVTFASEKVGEPCSEKGLSISRIDREVFLCVDGKWSAHSTVETQTLTLDVVLTQDGNELLRTQNISLDGAPASISHGIQHTYVSKVIKAGDKTTLVPGALQTGINIVMIPKIKPNGNIEILVHVQKDHLVSLVNAQDGLQLPNIKSDAITENVELVGGKDMVLKFGEKSEFGLQIKATRG